MNVIYWVCLLGTYLLLLWYYLYSTVLYFCSFNLITYQAKCNPILLFYLCLNFLRFNRCPATGNSWYSLQQETYVPIISLKFMSTCVVTSVIIYQPDASIPRYIPFLTSTSNMNVIYWVCLLGTYLLLLWYYLYSTVLYFCSFNLITYQAKCNPILLFYLCLNFLRFNRCPATGNSWYSLQQETYVPRISLKFMSTCVVTSVKFY